MGEVEKLRSTILWEHLVRLARLSLDSTDSFLFPVLSLRQTFQVYENGILLSLESAIYNFSYPMLLSSIAKVNEPVKEKGAKPINTMT